MSTKAKEIQIDVPTLIAVSIVAWALVNILHEIVGHAGTSILVGVPVQAVSTTTIYMRVNWDSYVAEHGLGPLRLILAGGSVANIVTGGLALLALRWKTMMSQTMRYFLWLFSTFSLVVVAMNMVTNPLLGFGDWGEILATLEQTVIWKVVIVGVGLALVVAGYIFSLRAWVPRMTGHRLAWLKITAIPVGTMILVQTLSVLRSPFATLPPERNHMLVSVFAYIHFVLWLALVNLIPGPRASDAPVSMRLLRSNAWLAVGLIVLVFYVVVLGPGIGSFAGDPRLL
jgi:hypothetical protein